MTGKSVSVLINLDGNGLLIFTKVDDLSVSNKNEVCFDAFD